MSVRIDPSILSADFVNFQREFETLGHADALHVDVMDNHFVPNLTFGLPMVKRMQEVSAKPLDVHLMIENVDVDAVKYAETGVFSVTFHLEAANSATSIAKDLRAAGARAGLAIKPNTNLNEVVELLPHFDQLLVMTVEPGFGGQALIENTLEKVAKARRLIDTEKLDVWLQVDGGIDESNIERVAALGADTFVAGSAVFKATDRNAQIDRLRGLAEAGFKHLHL
jgi:ribulose-phosphate 3-epimerase